MPGAKAEACQNGPAKGRTARGAALRRARRRVILDRLPTGYYPCHGHATPREAAGRICPHPRVPIKLYEGFSKNLYINKSLRITRHVRQLPPVYGPKREHNETPCSSHVGRHGHAAREPRGRLHVGFAFSFTGAIRRKTARPRRRARRR